MFVTYASHNSGRVLQRLAQWRSDPERIVLWTSEQCIASARFPRQSTFVETPTCVAVGTVRLDNATELCRQTTDWRSLKHLELVVALYEMLGAESVRSLIGDFAFAIWDKRTRRLT